MNTTILKGTHPAVQAVQPGDLDGGARRRAEEAAAAAAEAAAREPEAEERPCAETRVTPLRLNGVVHAIEVQCACGEVTVVELDYPAAPEAGAPSADPAAVRPDPAEAHPASTHRPTPEPAADPAA